MRFAPVGILLGIALLSTPEVRADGFSVVPPMPERAGIPVAYVDGQRFPIVGYSDGEPVIRRDGKVADARHATISLVPGGTFAVGNLVVQQANALHYTLKTQSDAVLADRTDFDAKLTADRDRQDVFLVLFVFEDLAGGTFTEIPRLALLGSRVGHLSAGTPHRVHVAFPPLGSVHPLRWAALFFDGGAQFHTDGVSTLDSFFDLEDHIGLQRAISERQSGNFPLGIYRHFPMSFTPEQKARFAGQTVNVHAFVSPGGTFDYVQGDDQVDPPFARYLAGQLSYWLFLPQVKNGVPVESAIVLPLRF